MRARQVMKVVLSDDGRIGLSKHGVVPICYRAGLTFFEWFWGQTLEPVDSDCWEWQGSHAKKSRYGIVFVPGFGREVAHRAAWALIHGPVPDDLWVLHTCDNPPCVRPSHLYAGTLLDNVRDRVERGRGSKGEKHSFAMREAWARRMGLVPE